MSEVPLYHRPEITVLGGGLFLMSKVPLYQRSTPIIREAGVVRKTRGALEEQARLVQAHRGLL